MIAVTTSPPRGEHRARPRKATAVFSGEARLGALGLLFLAASAFGGGARADITSLIVLRPLSFVLLAYALMAVSWQDWKQLGMPASVVAGIAAIAALQLVPLPPSIWMALPGRELAGEIAQLLGWTDQWRPLSLDPARTYNALFALGVPLATLALFAGLPAARRHLLIWAMLALGGASILLGMAQVMGPADGPLYLYRITNDGIAVGLFSNRNHHAIFLASLIPLLGFVALTAWERRKSPGRMLHLLAAGGGLALIIPTILVTGSRAGTALALVMTLALAAITWRKMDARPSDGKGSRTLRKLVAPAIVAAVGLLALATHLASRSLAFQRFLGGDMDNGLRADLLPHLWSMLQSHFPVGTGFGAFRTSWEVIEPRALLRPQYLNQAHNDLLQFVIEGGVAALLVLVLGLIWFVRAGLKAWHLFKRRAASGEAVPMALFTWLALATFLLGSLFDYPLRTPALMAVAALLAGLTQLSLSPAHSDGPSGRTSS